LFNSLGCPIEVDEEEEEEDEEDEEEEEGEIPSEGSIEEADSA
jgi:hypothetical protein